MTFTSRFKKKEKKVTSPKAKVITQKSANLFVSGILAFVLAVVLIGTIRNFTSAQAVDNLKNDVQKLQEVQRSSEQKESLVDLPLVQRYMEGFIPTFMNVDLSTDEKVQERLDKLSEYAAFDFSNINDGLTQKMNRKVISFDLLSVQSYDQYDLAKYKITYEINEEQLHDEEVKAIKSETTTVLNIPFVSRNGLLSIISEPYFTSDTSIFGSLEALVMMEESDTSEAMSKEKVSIEEYLPTFFTKYAEGNETDLSLLMKEVELMGGNFVLEEVHLPQAKYAFVGENVLMQVLVTFKDKETNFVHSEPFTLLLEKQANSWFVLEMHHLFIQ